MVNLSASALADYDEIVERSYLLFGARQAKKYATQIDHAALELARLGDKAVLLRRHLELQPVLYSYPLARIGQRARHQFFVSFDIERGDSIVNILRILHDRMDFVSHLLTDHD